MSKIDELLSESAIEENNNASNKIEQSEVVAVDCSTFEKTQSQVFGNTFSIVFMGIYAEEKDVSMLRPDIEYVLGKMKHISEYYVVQNLSVSPIRNMKMQSPEFRIHTQLMILPVK